MNDDKIIKSYVWHKEQCYFVSTIERDSSAMGGPRRYNETIVWKCDWDKNERGIMVYMDSDAKGSIRTHNNVCERLYADAENYLKQESEE